MSNDKEKELHSLNKTYKYSIQFMIFGILIDNIFLSKSNNKKYNSYIFILNNNYTIIEIKLNVSFVVVYH
jgi:hypothetical protein